MIRELIKALNRLADSNERLAKAIDHQRPLPDVRGLLKLERGELARLAKQR